MDVTSTIYGDRLLLEDITGLRSHLSRPPIFLRLCSEEAHGTVTVLRFDQTCQKSQDILRRMRDKRDYFGYGVSPHVTFILTPTPRVIDGDGSRSHWVQRRESRLRRERSRARDTREAWLNTAPEQEETD